jgi:TRAP-type transport system small permease protein
MSSMADRQRSSPNIIEKTGHVFKKVIYGISRVTNAIGAALLMIMMLLVTIDVILRSVANQPILGTMVYESIGFMMVVLVFFALAYCQIQKGHVNIDMIIVHLSKKAQKVINSIMLLMSTAFFALLAWQSYLRAFDLIKSKTISTALSVPVYPFLFLVAFGSALLFLVLLINFVDSVTGGTQK